MKYVRLKHPQLLDLYRMCPVGSTHAHIAAECQAANPGYIPFSAGIFRVLSSGRVETFGMSTSLGLVPHPQDAKVLSCLYSLTQTEGGRPSRAPFLTAQPSVPA